MKRTKVQILNDRVLNAGEAVGISAMRMLEYQQRVAPPVGECATCGAPFATAYDFDAHYLVDDERYLNLGNCPKRYNNGRLMPILHSPWSTKDLWDEAHELNRTKDLLKAKGTPITLEDYNKLQSKEELIPLTRHICSECGAAYHSDEEKATICNRCSLGLPHKR